MTNVTNTSNHRFIKALLKQPVDKTPIWIMRQAGRYLPEYREIRQKAGSFMDLCQNPDLACQVTLQPLQRFDLDAAILFSDILTIPDAMGLGLYFEENQGPKFESPIQSEKQIQALGIPDPHEELSYVIKTVETIKHELADKKPLIGFSGSPWTLATYMVEGGSSKTFSKIKGMIYQNPRALHLLLEKLSQAVTNYLNAQINAGADAVMIFDTWGGVLSQPDYENFSLAYMQKIIANLTKENNGQPIPNIIFTKNGGQWLEKIAASGCSCVGLDWTTNIADARRRIGTQVALQGNLDPCVLYGSAEKIREQTQQILSAFGNHQGHVFNLGHGIYPDMDPEKVAVLVNAVHEFTYDQNQ